ncbi:arabinose operon protein AraL [Caldalkalibacillus uzonensis]|uniref:Acid sugar phosphatase n=1 Tax=Caldalkalibacillus uzonensis TaxID=353224 RepID=A0ABU0CXJ5_9BACI|nr:arabinose operon protein AraL [Caldalkalibacillus uzonensis]
MTEVGIIRGFIFDLDGTVYLGDQPIKGAAEAINTLQQRGDRVVFLSNKPIATRMFYVEKLRKMGIEASLENVLNSNYIMAYYLKDILTAEQSVFVIGEWPLIEELEAQEIPITQDPLQADYVILSWDRYFTYDKLNAAFQAWFHGAKIIATNPDRTCPIENGQIPDCGAIIGAIEGATGQAIDAVVGKPSAIMAETAVKKLGLDFSQCYMVGDRLETDIKMANETGMNSVLVLTGITTEDMLATSPYQPKYVLNSIADIPSI